MWSSDAGWVGGLRSWVSAAVLRAVCARLGCSITTATLLAIAAVMAEYADHATGRNMCATRATIAARVGCTPRTVTTAWRVLRETGWAVEAARGHGDPSTPAVGRRPSVWHLTPRRAVEFFHLPPLSRESGLSPVDNDSPSAREGVRVADSSHQARPGRRKRRPAAAYTVSPDARRLGAYLAGHSHGLFHALDRPDRQHSGSLAIALERSGLDLAAWSGRQLAAAIDADMRARSWSWPDSIKRPGAFLASRLRRLPARPDRTLNDGGTAAGPDKTTSPAVQPTPVPPRFVPVPPAPCCDPAVVAAAKAHYAEYRARRHASADTAAAVEACGRHVVVSGSPVVEVPAAAGCLSCGRPGVVRPFLPARRSVVCDDCWEASK